MSRDRWLRVTLWARHSMERSRDLRSNSQPVNGLSAIANRCYPVRQGARRSPRSTGADREGNNARLRSLPLRAVGDRHGNSTVRLAHTLTDDRRQNEYPSEVTTFQSLVRVSPAALLS